VTPAGEGIPVVLGDTLYIAGAFYNPSNAAEDLHIRVYRAAICRNCASCGTPATGTPYLDLSMETAGYEQGIFG
jgi:hypothetical protein